MYEEAINQAVKDWEAMERDAARYRLLRAVGATPLGHPMTLFARDLDAVVDGWSRTQKEALPSNGS